MSIKEIEAAALKLVPKDRARLAGKLLESLEGLSDEENELIWSEEAERRDGVEFISGCSTNRKESAAQCASETSINATRLVSSARRAGIE